MREGEGGKEGGAGGSGGGGRGGERAGKGGREEEEERKDQEAQPETTPFPRPLVQTPAASPTRNPQDFPFPSLGRMEEEQEAARKRKMPREPQAGNELSMETMEDKSLLLNVMEEAVLSSSTAQESKGEEKPRRSCTKRG